MLRSIVESTTIGAKADKATNVASPVVYLPPRVEDTLYVAVTAAIVRPSLLLESAGPATVDFQSAGIGIIYISWNISQTVWILILKRRLITLYRRCSEQDCESEERLQRAS